VGKLTEYFWLDKGRVAGRGVKIVVVDIEDAAVGADVEEAWGWG
jgi:hypothetical protein